MLAARIQSVMRKISVIKISKLPPFIQPIKLFIDEVVALYEKVRGDVMGFYNVSLSTRRVIFVLF